MIRPLWGMDPLRFFLGISAFAWAIGFVRYYDHWVYFPAFPNALDSIGMALIGAFLLWEATLKRRLAPPPKGGRPLPQN